jgi:predicted esterase
LSAGIEAIVLQNSAFSPPKRRTPVASSEHFLRVRRTARYRLAGPIEAGRHLFVLHGYGQRAEDFIRPFEDVCGDDTCVIAPEALSRFYTDGMESHQSVGASWMTRAAREHEIADYVAYLDALADELAVSAEAFADEAGARPERWVLGFSQGAATASRWACLGAAGVDRLILWAGDLAHDLDLADHAERLRQLRPVLVAGTQDEYISASRREAAADRLHAHDVPVEVVTFDAGHRLHTATLREMLES